MNIPFNVVQHLVFVEVMETTFDLEPIINPHHTIPHCATHCLDLLLEDWGKLKKQG
jgi:hypothetical protein